MRKSLMLAAAIVPFGTSAARAQGAPIALAWVGFTIGAVIHVLPHPGVDVKAGDQVRIAGRGRENLRGTITSIGADSLRLAASDGSSLTIPHSAIQRMQRFDGKYNRWAEGWLTGLVAGT